MKRRISIILLLMTTLILFVSCTGGSYTMTIGSLNGSSKYIEGKYNSFNGKYYILVKLNKGDTIKCDVDCNTEDGEIKFLLLDKDKNVIADLKVTNSVDIVEGGYYYFTAMADKHKGGFKVEWSVE